MSGSTIGGVIGAVVGFYFGGPQGASLGWMIGSGVGAYVDPQKIEGPRLKDATKQTSQDGVPIPFGYGSFPTTGNLIWTDRLVETKSSKRGGKGGPKITEYVYTRSYAVGVCEGEIGGFLIIKRNGKIVYDTRTNDELTALGYTYEQIAESRAAQAKWLAVATLYYGDEAQTPDPTMSAVKGAGNVPSYRGLAYIVCTHEDLTEERGAVPQYDFVISVCGTREEQETAAAILITGSGSTPFITADTDAVPTFVGIDTSTGADVAQAACSVNSDGVWIAVGASEVVYSTSITTAWTNVTPVHGTIGRFGSYGAGGWLLQHRGASHTGLLARASSIPTDLAALTINIAGGATRTTLSMTAFTGGMYYGSVGFESSQMLLACSTIGGTWNVITTDATSIPGGSGDGIRFFHDIVGFEGALYASVFVATDPGYITSVGQQVRRSNDDGATWPELIVDGAADSTIPLQLCRGRNVLLVVNSNVQTVYTSADGFSAPHTTGVSRSAESLPRNEVEGRNVAYASRRFYIMGDSGVVSTENGIDFSAVATYPASFNTPISIAAFGYDGTELPDAPGHYVDDEGNVNGPGGTVVERCTPELGIDIVADLCARREVTDIDVSDLTDLVDGFKIATETDPGTAIDATRAAYFYDVSEYDGIVHFPKRGGAVSFALTMDDLAARDGDPIEWERVQEAELLRKVTVGYIDPDTTYTTTTQKWERRTGTVEAKGEASVEIPLVGRKDFAAQVAEKRGKAAWAETEKVRFSLPYKWAKLTTADVGTLTDALGKVHRIRILSIEDDGGYRHVEAAREQTNTYVSTATGTSGPNPTVPGTGLSGPTVAAIMNLPVLRDADDKAGLYIAAAGMLSGWQGALVQLSRNGSTYENGPIIAANATMGELNAVLPVASAYAPDNTNTLSVTLLPTSGDLSSCTFQDLLESEVNVGAILYTDGTAEILQFQTATEVSPGVYDLTGLLRGRKDTTIAEHAGGARFVLLDEAIRFAAIRPDDLGKTLTFRPVSVGTPAASNATQTITFTTIESLREWQPYNIVVTADGLGGYCVAWIGRARLGSSRTPVHSQWFEGYRVTFTIGSTVHEVDTTEQAICVSAATMLEAFGPGHGIPDVTVRARSRVATNDDDFDSPPGSPPSEQYPSYPGTIIGEPGDMYEGEGVLDHIGPWYNPPFQAYGGKKEEFFTGYITRNVTCQNSFAPASGFMVGIPLTAGTADADTTMWASGPDVVGGPFTITDSVTVLPMPAFAVMDELNAWGEKALATLVTTTPRTTRRVTSSGLGGLRSRAGFSTGQRRCEFAINDMPAGGHIGIGVLAAGVNAHLAPGTGGTFAHVVTGNGTFAVEVDAATGDVEVFELGVGLVASGTLPLTYAHDGKYRFAWVANDSTHYAHGATVHTNQGNEAWAITPTAGFGGVPNESRVIPCGWDAAVGAANGYWLQGTTGTLTVAGAGGYSGTSVVYAYSEFAKSTGTWRIGMGCGPVARIGLCKAGHTGLLGQGGDSFGMSYDFTVIGSPQLVFDTTWAGQIRIPHPFYAMDRKIIFVCDFDAHTVEVWGKPQFSDYILLTVLTGLPSGAWVPAGNHAVELINGASEIPGATDWSVTKTP